MNDQDEAPQIPAPAPGEKAAMVIPGFQGSPNLTLPIKATRESEARFIEVKNVNPITYTDLEHTFNESYRELKQHLATIGYQLEMAKKALRNAQSRIMLDLYPDFIQGKPKTYDNAHVRDAFLMRDKEYAEALDRISMLTALEAFMDGRIKTVENVCRYMRKRMDLIIRSGLSAADLYVTSGKK